MDGGRKEGKTHIFQGLAQSRSFLLSPLSHQCLPKLKSPPAIDSSFFLGRCSQKKGKVERRGGPRKMGPIRLKAFPAAPLLRRE